MKTRWTVDYLNNRMSGREIAKWRSQKRQELEQKTGVPWSDQHAAGFISFLPYLDYPHTDPTSNHVDEFIVAYNKTKSPLGYASFKAIQEVSGIPYPIVMQVAKGLIASHNALPNVNRMGKAVYIKILT